MYRRERGNYGHRFLNLCIIASGSANSQIDLVADAYEAYPEYDMANTNNVIQSLNYL